MASRNKTRALSRGASPPDGYEQLLTRVKPIGVSAYRIREKLPKQLAASFPTVGDLEKELTRGRK